MEDSLAVGFPCPECGEDGTVRPHRVLSFTKSGGFVVGLRVYCMACENCWDIQSETDGSEFLYPPEEGETL